MSTEPRIKRRNRAFLLVLLAIIALLYAMSMVKIAARGPSSPAVSATAVPTPTAR